MIVLDVVSPHQWKLKGPLTLSALSGQRELFKHQGPHEGQWQVDLSNIEQLDCAGVSFLLHLLRLANQHGVALHFVKLKKKYHALIEVYGVIDLLKPYFDAVPLKAS